MNDKIFRKKSIDRISSPEQMNDVIKVMNPGVWMILGAIIILLIGVCIWVVFGELTSTVECTGFVQDNMLTMYLNDADYQSITGSYEVQIGNEAVSFVLKKAENYSSASELSEYERDITSFGDDEAVHVLKGVCSLKDGVYDVTIIVSRVVPMSFLTD